MKNALFFLVVIIAATITGCKDPDGKDPGNSSAIGTLISFNSNGGSGTMAAQLIPENTSAALAANSFTRTGYTFAGWAVAGGTSTYADGAEYTAGAGSAAVTLNAQWTAKTSSITFNANGGSGGPSGAVTATYDQAMPAISGVPTRTNYDFEGYSDAQTGGTKYYNADLSSAAVWNKEADAVLYAIWTLVPVAGTDITFNTNGGSGGPVSTVAQSGQAMPALSAQPPTNETNSNPGNSYENNYEKKYFNGYYDAATGGTKYYNADLSSAKDWDKTDTTATLYAQWLTAAEKVSALRGETVTLGGAGFASQGWIDDFIAYKVDTPPAIDGAGTDPCWAKAKWMDINYLWMYQTAPCTWPGGITSLTPAGGRIPKVDDFKGRFKVVWTPARLYILVEIIDDIIKTPNTSNVYTNPENNDCLEIFISESASASTAARGTSSTSTSHFFAYHMNFTTMVDAMDFVGTVSASASLTDPNTRVEGGFIKRNHHLNFKVGKNDTTHTYIWETEMKVYDNTYPVITSPEDKTPVTLTAGKKMGFAVAYNDNDDHYTTGNNADKRNHFFGSMYIEGATDSLRNKPYNNASVYAKLYLAE